jgi:superfamily I DNA/RNA helicase
LSPVTLDRTAPPTRSVPDLDEVQRSVVAHRSGPLLVLAGPGTGKTTTLVEAMIGRLTDPIAPVPAAAVLGLTFGRRAALDWRERVAARCPSGPVPDVMTFHSFAYALVRRFGVTDLFAPLPQVISSADQLRRVPARSDR